MLSWQPVLEMKEIKKNESKSMGKKKNTTHGRKFLRRIRENIGKSRTREEGYRSFSQRAQLIQKSQNNK